MTKGLDKIFDKAKEQIEEQKREKQRKERSMAPKLVETVLAESIQKAHESLLAFYEREDYRYRLSVMEMVAARLQSSWRGRQERARIFEENRKNRGSSQPIDCGWESTILVRPDGLVYTCGIGTACGIYWKKPGISLTLTSIPKLNVMAFKVSMVAAGGSHVIMMLSNYSVLSMGNNSRGQLGLGEDFPVDGTASAERVDLPDNLLASSVYAGTAHSMILTTDGSAFSFGFNSKGQLGIGRSLIDQFEPKKVIDVGPKNPRNTSRWLSSLLIQAGKKPSKIKGEKRAVYGSLGAFHSGILSDDGKLYLWGSSDRGRLGIGNVGSNIFFHPQCVKYLAKFEIIDFACGRNHTVAVTDKTEVFSWGDGEMVPLGYGNKKGKIEWIPREICSLIGAEVVKVSAGEKHTVLLTRSGRVLCFGSGKYGRCGAGEGLEFDILKPRVVDSLLGRKIMHIAAGRDFTWVVDSQNNYLSFGHGYYGCLGGEKNADRHIAEIVEVQDWIQYA